MKKVCTHERADEEAAGDESKSLHNKTIHAGRHAGLERAPKLQLFRKMRDLPGKPI
jgi:hypothetical protein